MENKHEVSVIILLMNSNKKRTYISHCICISKTNSPTSRVETWYFSFYFFPFFIKTSLYDSIADRQRQPPRSSKCDPPLCSHFRWHGKSTRWIVMGKLSTSLLFFFRCFTSTESRFTLETSEKYERKLSHEKPGPSSSETVERCCACESRDAIVVKRDN